MSKPVRILQVCYTMGLGGIETWLMNILRNIDRDRFRFDFLVYTTQPQFYDDEIRSLGSRIIPCAHPSEGLKHFQDLKRILNREGPYDVIHAHGSQTIGNTLRMAERAGIKIRIAHSHNATRHRARRIRSLLFEPVARYWLHKSMTIGLGVSEAACFQLFGKGWKFDRRCRVLGYGIDWDRYKNIIDRKGIRAKFKLPGDSLVIGHVGRFVPEKNHQFFLKVASQIARMRNDVCFLLVGDGSLKPSVEAEVKHLGLDKKFILVGVQTDIPALLQGMDVLLFPSLFEGLPIALLEAQAVGLPCVISDSIPLEAIAIEKQVTRLPLDVPVDIWADAVIEASKQDREKNHPRAWEAVSKSRFSLQSNIKELSHLYQAGSFYKQNS